MIEDLCTCYLRLTRLYTAAVNELCIDPKEVQRWRWTRHGHMLECPICIKYRAEMAELVKQIGKDEEE